MKKPEEAYASTCHIYRCCWPYLQFMSVLYYLSTVQSADSSVAISLTIFWPEHISKFAKFVIS